MVQKTHWVCRNWCNNAICGAENVLGGAKSGAINDANGAENTLGGAINGAINDASGAKNILEEKIKNRIL